MYERAEDKYITELWGTTPSKNDALHASGEVPVAGESADIFATEVSAPPRPAGGDDPHRDGSSSGDVALDSLLADLRAERDQTKSTVEPIAANSRAPHAVEDPQLLVDDPYDGIDFEQ